jgi:hypothetical protein
LVPKEPQAPKVRLGLPDQQESKELPFPLRGQLQILQNLTGFKTLSKEIFTYFLLRGRAICSPERVGRM